MQGQGQGQGPSLQGPGQGQGLTSLIEASAEFGTHDIYLGTDFGNWTFCGHANSRIDDSRTRRTIRGKTV